MYIHLHSVAFLESIVKQRATSAQKLSSDIQAFHPPALYHKALSFGSTYIHQYLGMCFAVCQFCASSVAAQLHLWGLAEWLNGFGQISVTYRISTRDLRHRPTATHVCKLLQVTTRTPVVIL